jgi:hypothetical protein
MQLVEDLESVLREVQRQIAQRVDMQGILADGIAADGVAPGAAGRGAKMVVLDRMLLSLTASISSNSS